MCCLFPMDEMMPKEGKNVYRRVVEGKKRKRKTNKELSARYIQYISHMDEYHTVWGQIPPNMSLVTFILYFFINIRIWGFLLDTWETLGRSLPTMEVLRWFFALLKRWKSGKLYFPAKIFVRRKSIKEPLRKLPVH